jgi:hypothetical protein
MHNRKEVVRAHQRSLAFVSEERWDLLPKARQTGCVGLLAQLLSQVVVAERAAARKSSDE